MATIQAAAIREEKELAKLQRLVEKLAPGVPGRMTEYPKHSQDPQLLNGDRIAWVNRFLGQILRAQNAEDEDAEDETDEDTDSTTNTEEVESTEVPAADPVATGDTVDSPGEPQAKDESGDNTPDSEVVDTPNSSAPDVPANTDADSDSSGAVSDDDQAVRTAEVIEASNLTDAPINAPAADPDAKGRKTR